MILNSCIAPKKIFKFIYKSYNNFSLLYYYPRDSSFKTATGLEGEANV